MVTQNQDLHTRVKPYDLQTLPRLCVKPDREKTSEADFLKAGRCQLAFVRFVLFLLFVRMDASARGEQLWRDPFRARIRF